MGSATSKGKGKFTPVKKSGRRLNNGATSDVTSDNETSIQSHTSGVGQRKASFSKNTAQDKNLNASPKNNIWSKDSRSRPNSSTSSRSNMPLSVVCRFNDVNDMSRDQNIIEARILQFKVGLDRKKITVDEKSPSVFKYRTPHFRASATVEIPKLSSRTRLNIGWIQVCTSLKFINVYGEEGITSWELPGLVTGQTDMISDSDGKRYPWYGSKREVKLIEGPTTHSTNISTQMNDNFYPQVTWYIPSPGYNRDARLTRVCRRQRFITCLVMHNANLGDVDHLSPRCPSPTLTNDTAAAGSFRVLRAIRWSMEVDISLDPGRSRGHRTTKIQPSLQEEPQLIDEENNNKLLCHRALRPPNANVSQTLIWRPSCGPAAMVVRPVDTGIDVHGYTDRTRDYYSQLKRETVENSTVS